MSCVLLLTPQEIEVSSPDGVVLGFVIQQWTLCRPKFLVTDPYRAPILRLEGGCCVSPCCGANSEFHVSINVFCHHQQAQLRVSLLDTNRGQEEQYRFYNKNYDGIRFGFSVAA